MTRNDIANVHREYTTPATPEQRAEIVALGGRPPEDLSPEQARVAIRQLRRRNAQRRRTGALRAHLAVR